MPNSKNLPRIDPRVSDLSRAKAELGLHMYDWVKKHNLTPLEVLKILNEIEADHIYIARH